MKLKKKLLISLLVTAALAVGVTLAFMFRQTDTVNNDFIPAKVSCEVEETFNGAEKSSIKVENTGNISSYLRVRLVSYWVNGEGEIVGKPSETPQISIADGWTKEGDSYYVYNTPVKPEEATGELLKEPLKLQTDEFDGETVYQVVEVFAEAIQAEPAGAKENS